MTSSRAPIFEETPSFLAIPPSKTSDSAAIRNKVYAQKICPEPIEKIRRGKANNRRTVTIEGR